VTYPLLKTFLRAAVECVGAQRAVLLLVHDANLIAFADAVANEQKTEVRLRSPNTANGVPLPHSLIEHVRQTQKTLVIADADMDNPFIADEYFSGQHPRGALCLPIIHLGEPIAVLYFESDAATHTFASAQSAGLETLCAHAAAVLIHEDLHTDLPITKARHAKAALRESEERYRSLYDDTPSMYFTVDPDGKVLSVNQFGATYLGYTIEELTGQSVLRVFVDDDKAAATHHVSECLAHPGQVFQWELRKTRKDGSRLWVHEAARAVRDARGALSVMIVCEDITERKRVEEALRESEERYRALYHDTPSMYFTVDPDGKVLSVNQFGATYLGYTIEELTGQSVLRVFLAADKASAVQHVAKCVASPGWVFQWELRKTRKDGTLLWVHETARALRDADGTLSVMIVCEDITERKRAEEAVHLRNRAMESTHNAIIIANSSREEFNPIMYVNPAFERITGYTAAEALGRDWRFLIGTDYDQPDIERLADAIKDGTEVRAVLRNYRKDGTLFWNELSFAPVLDESGRPTHFISVINDVTDRVRYERELEHQANYDFLTGLANRNLLRDRLNQTLTQAQRSRWLVAVIFIDLDHFKVINDSMGHDAGDALVRAVAQRLLGCVREVDTVARLGGDEFVIVLPDAANEDAVTNTIQRIQDTLTAPFGIEGHELYVTCSMGASIYPRDGIDGDTLLKHADIAMYRAKELGRDTFQYHRADMNVKVNERFTLESSLRRALERDELLLHYQPIIETTSGRLVGAEALVRWQHPEEGMILPARFIPVAEESGLILPLGEWVLDKACQQARLWQARGMPTFSIAVNLSPRQFRQHNLADIVARALANNQLAPQHLHLELTESMVMQHIEDAMRMAQRLKALGVSLSLDDFGTGYSSLNHLKRFPIDTIKIDRSFVRDIPNEADNAAIASAVIAMARSLNVTVIAEGVEAKEQRNFLDARQCHQIQGYYVSRPLPANEFERFLGAWSSAA